MEQRASKVREEMQRLVGLGATKLHEVDEEQHFHITMADPEGNEFCIS